MKLCVVLTIRSLLRMKSLLEQRRSVIDLKIRRYTGYQFEKENLMVYHLSKASRTACLLKVVHDAVSRVIMLLYRISALWCGAWRGDALLRWVTLYDVIRCS